MNVGLVKFAKATMPPTHSRSAKERKQRVTSASSQKVITIADEIALPCTQCSKMVSEKGLQCSFCDNWYCNPCTDLSEAVLKSLDNTPECLMWFCRACLTALPGLKKLLIRVTACETEHESMNRRLEKLEQKEQELQLKSSELEEKVNSVSSGQSGTENVIQNSNSNISEVIDSVLMEKTDREKRKLNLIAFNMPECDKQSSLARREDDLLSLRELFFSTLNVDSDIEISDPVRLGKRIDTNSDESDKPRPLRFKVVDTESKNISLKASKYLRSSNDEAKKQVYVTPDLTKKQRDEAYNLREEKRR